MLDFVFTHIVREPERAMKMRQPVGERIRFNLILSMCIWLLFDLCPYQGYGQGSEKERVKFEEFTFREIEALGKRGTTVFIPVAQIEAHGPHLPVGAHLFCAEGICTRAARSSHGIVGVPITLGDCLDFAAWPGYIVINTQTLMEIFKHYCESLQNQGFKRLIFFSCAGGNVMNTLSLAAGEHLKSHPNGDIVLAQLGNLLTQQTVQTIQKQDADILTSMMLALRPALMVVGKDSIRIKGDLTLLRQASRFRKGYELSAWFPDAVFQAKKGSRKEIGEQIIFDASEGLRKLASE